METISFGGLGDTFVVYLKLRGAGVGFDHRHFFISDDRNNTLVTQQWLSHPLFPHDWKVSTQYEPLNDMYQKFGKYSECWEVPYSWKADCDEPLDVFIAPEEDDYEWDVCLQCHPGTKTDPRRRWNFDISKLKKDLEQSGLRVCMIGNAKEFSNQSDAANFVGKLDVCGNIDVVRRSRVMVSNLGFLSMVKMAGKGSLVYFCGNCRNEDYVHWDWRKYGIEVAPYEVSVKAGIVKAMAKHSARIKLEGCYKSLESEK
jgi:hypothetical protein